MCTRMITEKTLNSPDSVWIWCMDDYYGSSLAKSRYEGY